MRNYYLFEPSLLVASIEALEEGINNLNSIFINRDVQRDFFLCNSTIWEFDTSQGRIYEMFSGIVNSELQRVIPILFRSLATHDNYYTDLTQMDSNFPADCNAFAGFDFSQTQVTPDRTVSNHKSYLLFVSNCLKYGTIINEIGMKENLSLLFPKFIFSERAISETLEWKKGDLKLYNRVLALLNDIPPNPFMGGIGETEVLKYKKGVASKRINSAHRVTYKIEQDIISILACNGHYD